MANTAHLNETTRKSTGAHYTPWELATFLAEVTLSRCAKSIGHTVRVLDPACGDGTLLCAIAASAPRSLRTRMELIGYETDAIALDEARERLECLDVNIVRIRNDDFLEAACDEYTNELSPSLFSEFGEATRREGMFDVVISNPPYVRTQVLGASRSRQLASRFQLTGRVDLYHAFVCAISTVLKPGGVLGLLTSNRFMLIQSGASMRALLRKNFHLRDLYDLGDTKLFKAAVLPAVLVGERANGSSNPTTKCPFARVYEMRCSPASKPKSRKISSVLSALRGGLTGPIITPGGRYLIERGQLAAPADHSLPWSLNSPRSGEWLAKVEERRGVVFGEIARIRVGLKTTADKVFVRDDWHELPEQERPEDELLNPLITHHVAARWRMSASTRVRRRVLYPHTEDDLGKKAPIDLDAYPRAKRYLESHRAALESRKYLIDAGRKWFEIWVPQQPRDWRLPKVVFPDIAERPRFFFESEGYVVNGDCYWITLKPEMDCAWLMLLLAVANSSFIERYYDTVFHNKLYAGRRRFMTQYVKLFPLPPLHEPESVKIIAIVEKMLAAPASRTDWASDEKELDDLVYASFGLCGSQIESPM